MTATVRTFIGIDPGVHGGIAFLTSSGVGSANPLQLLPGKPSRIDADFLATQIEIILKYEPVAVVEKVHAMPKQGVTSMFSFGVCYGTILGVLGALRVPVELVTPQAWKKVILAGTDRNKGAAITYCKRRFQAISLLPTNRCTKPHDGMADALCLAEYGRRLVGGKS